MARKTLLGLALTTGVAAVLASSASAGITLRIGTPDLVARVAINVPVAVSCTPFDAALTQTSGELRVSVEQAAGQSIARGTGTVFGGSLSPPFACDGAEHLVNVSVLADPLGPPFHGRTAVFSARASATAGTPCFPGTTSCFTNLVTQSGVLDPTALKLH